MIYSSVRQVFEATKIFTARVQYTGYARPNDLAPQERSYGRCHPLHFVANKPKWGPQRSRVDEAAYVEPGWYSYRDTIQYSTVQKLLASASLLGFGLVR